MSCLGNNFSEKLNRVFTEPAEVLIKCASAGSYIWEISENPVEINKTLLKYTIPNEESDFMKKSYKDDCYEADFSCGNSALALCKKTGKEVFIKRWYSYNVRGKNEISVSDKIQNEYVLKFFETFTEDGMLYAVRDWIDGVSLAELVFSEKALSLSKALDIMIKICMVLRDISDVHGPFVHADIRPSNILYNCDNKKIWLIDLETFTFLNSTCQSSISGLLQKGGYTVSVSTEGFSAPEVYTGEICIQSDIFSLGKLFAFLLGLCGSDGVFIRPGNRKIHKDAMRIIRKSTNSLAEKRYKTVGELLDELCELFNVISVFSESSLKKEEIDNYKDSECIDNTERTLPAKVIPFRNTGEKNSESICLSERHGGTVVYIAGNTCFASEFSYIAASRAGLKTVLLENNSSIGIGALDYFIGKNNNEYMSYVCENQTPFFCDCRHLYLTDEKQWVIRGILSSCRHSENLYLSDCNVFSEFDISDENDLETLFGWTEKYFDMTVVCDTADIPDSISGMMMKNADYIIIPVRPDIDEVYAAFKQYRQYCIKYGCSYERLLFVAWEYEEGISMPVNDFKIAVDNLYGGAIPYDPERLKCKNIKGDFYCEQHEKEIYVFYGDLIKRMTNL